MTITARLESELEYIIPEGSHGHIKYEQYVLHLYDGGFNASLLGISVNGDKFHTCLSHGERLIGDDIPEPLRPHISHILFERT